MKIAIIREGKIPPDNRVPLTPEQCAELQNKYSLEVLVQSSPNRCFSNQEYEEQGIKVVEDISDCDILLGVKEVPVEELIPGKTYLFFSHTIKEQVHNRRLLQAILKKKIRLIDYEVLTDEKGARIIAFGKFAGVVGAHNAIWTYGIRTRQFELPRMHTLRDYKEAKEIYKQLHLPPLRIVLTGTGRVGNGAAQVLRDMNIREVNPSEYLKGTFNEAVFTQLSSEDYVAPKNGAAFDRNEFHANPGQYKSIFFPYASKSDIMINGIYWDKRAPAFFTKEDMKSTSFKIRVIADITCDIAPDSSIPSTLRASSITSPVYGYDAEREIETSPFQSFAIDVMAVDNLPNELPREASRAFGGKLLNKIFDELLHGEESETIRKATIAEDGRLGPHFGYLNDYVSAGYVNAG